MKTKWNKAGKIGLTICGIALSMVWVMMGRSEASSQSLSSGEVQGTACEGQSSVITRWKTGVPRCRPNSPITPPVGTVKRDRSICGDVSSGITTWKNGVPRCQRDSTVTPPLQTMAKRETDACGETSIGTTTWTNGAPVCR